MSRQALFPCRRAVQLSNTRDLQRLTACRYSTSADGGLNAFKQLTSQQPKPSDYPLAATIQSRIPIYDAHRLRNPGQPDSDRYSEELQRVLHTGPGFFVLKRMYQPSLLERVNEVFDQIIRSEEAVAGGQKGDHFAPAGANSRIWNSFGKHSRADPASFAAYYSHPLLRLVSEAWLGPAYRLTAQANIVRPGGKAQSPHRDYHLGFQTAKAARKYPKATQVACQFLTLQGAVAHCDMSLDSGPTRYLPFSQMYADGYSAYRDPAFQEYFAESWISLPMEAGDGVFFSPALFHAAGENVTTDVQRSANLLQVSSAFGKPMESIDTIAVTEACWDELLQMHEQQGLSENVEALIAAVAEGYPFPTNLDRRPPGPDGMAPESEQDVVRRLLAKKASREETVRILRSMKAESSM